MFIRNLADLAAKRAINIREEALLWDVLSRDLKREAKRLEDKPKRTSVSNVSLELIKDEQKEDKLFLRIPEAARMIGISRSSLYKEINAGHIKVRKLGKSTLIATDDIRAWLFNLPEGLSR